MAERFRGQFETTVDGKGRMSVPARLRRVLEAEDPGYPANAGAGMILRYGRDLEDYAEVYHVNAMAEIDDLIDEMEYDDYRKWMESNFQARQLLIEVDSDGRVVIPKTLRDRFGLDGKVVLSGRGNHFRIASAAASEDADEALHARVMEGRGEGFDPRALLPKRRKPPVPADD